MASKKIIKELSHLATRVKPASSFSTATIQAPKAAVIRNRPLSPFLSQKRPEKSSIISIGERMTLITLGVILLPAPEIIKMSHFLY